MRKNVTFQPRGLFLLVICGGSADFTVCGFAD